MDFVFDRTADGRIIKCLTIIEDATHESVGIEVERVISGQGLTRVRDRLSLDRGLPKMFRTDNGKEFCRRAMIGWAHEHGVQLRRIVQRKLNQNVYIESFNSRLRDECLNEHWFTLGQLSNPGVVNTTTKESLERNEACGLWQAAGRTPATVIPDSKPYRC